MYPNLGRPENGVAEQPNFAFACARVSDEPCAGDECLDAGWFSGDEALRLVDAPQQAGTLRDALSAAPGVIYRSYSAFHSRCAGVR